MEIEELREIEPEKIRTNPYQPRKYFAAEEIQDLAASISSVGLIHPPVVRPHEDGVSFELVSGERRFRACQLIGWKKIPVLVRSGDRPLSAQAALIENIQRVDLDPIEIAKALQELMELLSLNQEAIAQKVGKKRSTVANYLRLLSLPKYIQQGVSQGEISMGHAKAILSLDAADKQDFLYELILRDELTVRETEQAALRIAEKAKKKKLVYETRDFYLEQLGERLQEALGTKVSLQRKGKGGRISIDYYGLDDLDRILSLFAIEM